MRRVLPPPECPEAYYSKPLCKAARVKGTTCECTALNDTDFGLRHCPFYKPDKENVIYDSMDDIPY